MRGELSVIASKPERVVGFAGAKGVFVGSRVTCVRTSSGEVTCFGLVGLGDSGADLRVPRTTFPDLAGAKDLFLGSGAGRRRSGRPSDPRRELAMVPRRPTSPPGRCRCRSRGDG